MIIKRDDSLDYRESFEEGLPDLFVTSSKLEDKEYVKKFTDFFTNKAIRDVKINIDTFGRNYKFFEGELDTRDFYEASLDPETDNFIMDVVGDREELPEYVRLYSILSQPINALAGEITQSPSERIIRAFDADSLNEVIEEKSKVIEEFISSKINNRMQQIIEEQGLNTDDPAVQEQVAQMTEEELSDRLSTITTNAEKWGNRKLKDLKAQINYIDLEERAIYSLLKTGKAVMHVYEDNSSQGFGAEHVDETLVSTSLIKGTKFYSKSYQNSIVRLMEISEVIDRFPLTKEEIDHIKEYKEHINEELASHQREKAKHITGIQSIRYNPPAVWSEDYLLQDMVEKYLCGAEDMGDIFRHTGVFHDLGNYVLVVENYILCKELLGELTFIDEDGDEVTVPVDSEYKDGSHPTEVSIEWGYVNRWFKATRIGAEVYKLEPVDYVSTSPVVGIDLGKGLLDLMKDRQIIYSLCINQLWELLQKELGVVFSFDWTRVPVGKEEEYEDALDSWLGKAEELGIVFGDNDPQKLKVGVGQQEVAKAIDLSRSNEMRARVELASAIKEEAYELVGISRSRLGSNLASETATSITNSRKSSYSQTMVWYNAHNNLFNEFYQTLLDTAQYYESQKEESTIVLSSTDGERVMLQILGSELTMRDLRVFLTSSPEDLNDLTMAKELGMTMLQNGVDPYVVSKVLFTNSIREIQEAFKQEKDNMNKARQKEAQEMDKARAHEYAIETMKEKSRRDERREEREFQAKENQLDRISKEKQAVIRAYGFREGAIEDSDDSGQADILEVLDREDEVNKAQEEYERSILDSNQALLQEQNNISRVANENKQRDKLTEKEIEIKEKQLKIQERKAKTDEKKVAQQLEVAKYYDKGKKKD